MVSPTTEETRMYFWDYLRKKLDIDITRVSSKRQLIKMVREKFGLKPYQRATGKMKSVLSFLQKTDFWQWREKDLAKIKVIRQRHRSGKEYIRTYRRWTEEELNILKQNMDKPAEEIKKILWKMGYYRTESSIKVKLSRLRSLLRFSKQ